MKTNFMRQTLEEVYLRYEGEIDFDEWLDLELENAPEGFDVFFETPWCDLTPKKQAKRIKLIKTEAADIGNKEDEK